MLNIEVKAIPDLDNVLLIFIAFLSDSTLNDKTTWFVHVFSFIRGLSGPRSQNLIQRGPQRPLISFIGGLRGPKSWGKKQYISVR
jgi:hypothetical protein